MFVWDMDSISSLMRWYLDSMETRHLREMHLATSSMPCCEVRTLARARRRTQQPNSACC